MFAIFRSSNFHIVTTIDTFKLASEGAFSMDERSVSFLVKQKEL